MARKLKIKPAAKPVVNPKIAAVPGKKRVLHVGCGEARQAKLHAAFSSAEWQEVRMDNRVQAKPDIVGNITSMPMIGKEEYQGVFLPHILSRYYAHQVPIALRELFRILKIGGTALISVPDIQKIAEFVAKGTLENPLFKSDLGPVSALDLLYGFRPTLESGDTSESQKVAFTAKTLAEKLKNAGFVKIQVRREGFVIWAIVQKLAKGNALQVEIIEPDINQLMRKRDELDKEPEISIHAANP